MPVGCGVWVVLVVWLYLPVWVFRWVCGFDVVVCFGLRGSFLTMICGFGAVVCFGSGFCDCGVLWVVVVYVGFLPSCVCCGVGIIHDLWVCLGA